MFLPFLKKRPKNINYHPHVLLILDGYGIAPMSEGNAILKAKHPNMEYYSKTYPHCELIASGEAVGLPANEVGNTEVGHLTIGAGRVIFQDLKRIDLSIEDASFYSNSAINQAILHSKKNNSNLHIAGIVGSGNVHASIRHLYALLQFCKAQEFDRVYLHLFTDGRDSPPQEGVSIIQQIQEHLERIKIGQIATISGRYYAMDRDRRWERTEKAYKVLTEGIGRTSTNPVEAIKESYKNNISDEFIEPTVILSNNKPIALVQDNDSFIFFNFRVDRPRQLTMAFVLNNFENLENFEFGYVSDTEKAEGNVNIGKTFIRTKRPQNLFFVTMTEYQKNIPVSAIAFPPYTVDETLSQVLADAGIKQLHLAESEKERFITYYFDGMRQEKFKNEDVIIVPSPKVATYDKKPEMSAFKIVDELKKALVKEEYQFIAVNFANADMVGHSGNLTATIKAIEYLDQAVGQVVNEVLKYNGTIYITADHGNAEELLTYKNTSFFFTTDPGSTNTDHSNNPVPLIIINNNLANKGAIVSKGSLSDVATTILAIMNIPKPASMTGKSLLELENTNI